jgi:hypothetical protein
MKIHLPRSQILQMQAEQNFRQHPLFPKKAMQRKFKSLQYYHSDGFRETRIKELSFE